VAQSKLHALSKFLEQFAVWMTKRVGSSWAFLTAVLLTIGWLVTGPLFDYSDTWQLVMNTFTSIVTFLMVFLLQRSQNKDALAMQIKLDELLGAVKGASNRLIDVEDLSEEEVRELHRRFQQLARDLRNGAGNVASRCSIEQTLMADEAAKMASGG
jgi:low affinity Fe/Cu permease